MRLFIEPSDVLFFRTSRPFNAGESGYLLSLFPPTPETVQGAIRARIAAYFAAEWEVSLAGAFEKTLQNGSRPLQQLIGNHKSYGAFRLRGLTLGRREKQNRQKITALFPAPAHLLRGEDSGNLYRLAPRERDATRFTNMPDDLWLLEPEGGYPKEKLEDFQRWLTLDELGAALSADSSRLKAIKGIPARKLFTFEPRLGIGINNATKTTQEGFLYQVSFVRLKPGVGFLVDVGLEGVEPGKVQETLHLPEKGWLALGGERRAASFEMIGPAPDEQHLVLARGERMCVYLSTPAYFTSGWKPDDWGATFGAAPIAAAVPRATLIGGWQQEPGNARGAPKLLRQCVPAGSVYFFRSPVNAAGPVTNYGREIGYGIAYKGVWSHV